MWSKQTTKVSLLLIFARGAAAIGLLWRLHIFGNEKAKRQIQSIMFIVIINFIWAMPCTCRHIYVHIYVFFFSLHFGLCLWVAVNRFYCWEIFWFDLDPTITLIQRGDALLRIGLSTLRYKKHNTETTNKCWNIVDKA